MNTWLEAGPQAERETARDGNVKGENAEVLLTVSKPWGTLFFFYQSQRTSEKTVRATRQRATLVKN